MTIAAVRKSDITPELVARLVAEQFPEWADLPVRRVDVDGVDNTTFRLGETMSVRLPSSEWYRDQTEKEQRWLPVLAAQLPLPVPAPIAMGEPADDYPMPWSVNRWIDGDTVTPENVADLAQFASAVAGFLTALYKIDPAGGPQPGQHSCFRGAPLTVYDSETRDSLAALEGHIDTRIAADVWRAALHADWQGPPVWFHGDIAPGNLLVTGGQLSAVIDFGCCGVGDPACDTVIAWTFFSGESRRTFMEKLPVDDATWARGRGWAIWKAMKVLVGALQDDPEDVIETTRVIEEVMADHMLAASASR